MTESVSRRWITRKRCSVDRKSLGSLHDNRMGVMGYQNDSSVDITVCTSAACDEISAELVRDSYVQKVRWMVQLHILYAIHLTGGFTTRFIYTPEISWLSCVKLQSSTLMSDWVFTKLINESESGCTIGYLTARTLYFLCTLPEPPLEIF